MIILWSSQQRYMEIADLCRINRHNNIYSITRNNQRARRISCERGGGLLAQQLYYSSYIAVYIRMCNCYQVSALIFFFFFFFVYIRTLRGGIGKHIHRCQCSRNVYDFLSNKFHWSTLDRKLTLVLASRKSVQRFNLYHVINTSSPDST